MKSHGLTLLHAAAGLVILTLGLTGLLWLQQHHLRQQRQLLARAHALQLASDVVERIRLNPQQVAAYALTWQSTPPAAADCTQQACSRMALASWDVQQWLTHVRSELPEGRASIFPARDAPGWWGVLLAWHDPDASLRTDTLNGTPTCPDNMACWRLWFHPG